MPLCSNLSAITTFIITPRGLAPRTPNTLSRSPLRRLAPFAWLASLRSLASSRVMDLSVQPVESARDAELLAVDERCAVAREKEHRGRDLSHLSDASDGAVRFVEFAVLRRQLFQRHL